MSESPEEIKKNIRVHLVIFVSLALLTLVNVAASYLKLNPTVTLIVALVIASIQGLLVAGYFMHLFSEKITIYITLALTAIFFFVILLLPAGQFKGHLHGTQHVPTAPLELHPTTENSHHAA